MKGGAAKLEKKYVPAKNHNKRLRKTNKKGINQELNNEGELVRKAREK